MNKATLTLRNWLVQKRIVKSVDDIEVKRGMNTPSYVYRNGKVIGECSFNGKKQKFFDFKPHFKGKRAKTFKQIERDTKQERKEMWQKETYVVGDWMKHGKIKL